MKRRKRGFAVGSGAILMGTTLIGSAVPGIQTSAKIENSFLRYFLCLFGYGWLWGKNKTARNKLLVDNQLLEVDQGNIITNQNNSDSDEESTFANNEINIEVASNNIIDYEDKMVTGGTEDRYESDNQYFFT